MFNVLRRGIITDLLNGRITVEDFYRRMYITAVLITVAIFALSLIADVTGINGLNIILIPVWVLIVGYFGFHPTYILAAITTGATTSLGSDVARQRIIEGMEGAGGKWKQFFLHGALFGGVFFLTRFLVPIKAYPFAGMVMLGALITLGLWSWLYEDAEGKTYRRYVLALVLVSLTVGVFGAFAGKPSKDGHPSALIGSSLKGFVDGLVYSKTLEKEVSTLEPDRLCGVKPGNRMFTIPKGREVEVFISGDKTDISGAVRINDTLPGEKFDVESDGCVKISFVVNDDFQKKAFERQIIALTFE